MASPCAACKFLRRKCTSNCVFAPYFPPDQPAKFATVHKIFGASNVAKLLNDLPHNQREEAVNSLAYEAEARINDPVYGCVAYISILQVKIKEVQDQLELARKELNTYTTAGPSAFSSFHPPNPLITQNRLSAAMPASYMAVPFGLSNVGIGMDLGLGSSAAMPSHSVVPYRDAVKTPQQVLAMGALREQNLINFNTAVESMHGGYDGNFNSNHASSMQGAELVSPQTAQIQHQHQNPQASAFDGVFFVRPPLHQQVELQSLQQTQPQGQIQMQYYMETMKQQQQHRRVGSDEGRNCIRPSLP